MKSNLKKYYDKRYEKDIFEKKFLTTNPYSKLKKFFDSKGYDISYNFYNNLINLKIEEDEKELYSYDIFTNTLCSSCSKTDIYALLTLASADRLNRKQGVIDLSSRGYGLNEGITDFYNQIITNSKSIFPFENFVASVFYKIDPKTLDLAYFGYEYFKMDDFILYDGYIDLYNLLDLYHDNYYKLFNLYKDKFIQERYYFNLVYGNSLRKRNYELSGIENSIDKLEFENYTNVYDILNLLTDIVIENEKISNSKKKEILMYMNNKFKMITSLDELLYLSGLNNLVIDNKKVKELRK